LVVVLREIEDVANGLVGHFKSDRVRRDGQRSINGCRGNPFRGEVVALARRVLGDVADDVGQLQGYSEVDGKGSGARVSGANKWLKQETHSASHSMGEANEFIRRFDAPRTTIGANGIDQRDGGIKGKVAFGSERKKIRSDRIGSGTSRIEQTGTHPGELVSFARQGLISEIINGAAEPVEPRNSILISGCKQAGREIE
jgi:hypothetical protein